MDIEKNWEKALRNTEIVRSRVKQLMTSQTTQVPYILLSESSVNLGDTVVRRGEVTVDRPALIVPPNNPMFSGFEFEQDERPVDENSLVNFLLVRGVFIPSMRYDNHTSSIDVFDGKLSGAIKYYLQTLQEQENTSTGLLTGPEDCWQFSLMIFICSQIVRNAEHDIRKLLDEHRRNHDK